MKSKNGFTLVELLAVIAILAILVIIALPNVLDMFNQAKMGTFVTEAQTILKTAQQDYLLYSAVGGTFSNDVDCEDDDPLTIVKLNMTGNTKLKYKIVVDAEGTVTSFSVYDATFAFTYTIPEGDVEGLKIQNIKEDLVFDKAAGADYETIKTAVDGTCS